jgi:hypothetical protein
MADGGGGGAGMGVIVGALVVVVAVIGVFVFANGFHTSKSVDVNIHAPTVSAPAAPSTR